MTIVSTPLGEIQGKAGDGFERYAGIRYAQAPAGQLRFKAPVPVEPWDGVYDGTRYGASSPQVIAAASALFGERPGPAMSEDCLFLNVYTPKADDGRRPVMVWIHGGAYVGGSGDIYHGASFCRRGDVVVVTLNYRLGLLGFLPIDALDHEYAGAGNNGIRDQIEALRWVQQNITAFGGDPDNVTIFGESAGAGSVMALLAAPEAEGLFHKAIAQSPPTGFGPAVEPERLCREVLNAAGVASLDELLSTPVERILAAQESVLGASGIKVDPEKVAVTGGDIGLHPVVDGVVIHDRVADVLRAKGEGNVPLLTGTNLDEGTLFSMLLPTSLSDDDLVERLESQVPDAKRIVREHRARVGPGRPLVPELMTEAVFRIPTLQAVDAQVESGAPAWVYLFTWPTPVMGGMFGATHALEIPFVWGFVDRPGWSAFVGPDAPVHVSDAMHEAWIRFAREGDPGAQWPRYDSERRPTMVFDTEIRVEDDPVSAIRKAWYSEA
jgi:para-nitrobenzyl esterase